MLLRCLGPIQNRITELLGLHQTPSPLGNTPKDSDHSTDCHVGRKTIVLLLPVSFQDWNLLPSQILDNLYVPTNRPHRCNNVCIYIYICTWEKWKQKRHKVDRLEKGRGYRAKVKQEYRLWAQTTQMQFQDPVHHRKGRLMKLPKHIRLPTQKNWLSWGEEAFALNCVSNHQHLQKYSRLPNMIFSRLEYHKTDWAPLKWVVESVCFVAFCWLLWWLLLSTWQDLESPMKGDLNIPMSDYRDSIK